jgi:hypothetical protein
MTFVFAESFLATSEVSQHALMVDSQRRAVRLGPSLQHLNVSNFTVTRALRFSAKLLAGANTMQEYDPLVEILRVAEKTSESLGQIGKSAALRNLQTVLRLDRELSEGLQRRMAECLMVNSKQSEK